MWVPLVFLFMTTCRSSTSLGVHEEGNVGYRTHFRPTSQFGETARDWLKGVKDRFMGWVLKVVTPNMPKFDFELRDYGYSDYDYDYAKHSRRVADPCHWGQVPTQMDEPKRTTLIIDWSYDLGPLTEITEPASTESTTESLYYDTRENTRDDLEPSTTTVSTVLTTRYEEPKTVEFVSTTPTTQTDVPSILTTTRFLSTTQSVPEKEQPASHTSTTDMPRSESSTSENLGTESLTSTTTTQMQTKEWSITENLDPESLTSATPLQTTSDSTTFKSLFSTTVSLYEDTSTRTTEGITTSSDPGNTQYIPITIMTDSTSYSPTGETVTENDPPPVTMPVVDYDSDGTGVPHNPPTTTRAITDPTVDDRDQSVSIETEDSPNTQTTIPTTSHSTNEINTTEEPQSQLTTPTTTTAANDENDASYSTTNLPPTTTPIIFTTKKAKVEDNEVYKHRTSRKPPHPGSVEVLLPY